MLLALHPLVFVSSQSVSILLDCILTIEDGTTVNSNIQIELTNTLTSSDELTTQGSNSLGIDEALNVEDGITVLATLSITLDNGATLSVSMTTDGSNTWSIDETLNVEDLCTIETLISILADNSFSITADMTTDSSNTWLLDENFAVCSVNLEDLKEDLNNIMAMLLADESDVALFMLLETIELTR